MTESTFRGLRRATHAAIVLLLIAAPALAQVSADGDAFSVNTYTSGSQAHPSVAMDDDGDFVIVWDSGYLGISPQDGSAGGIFAQRFSSNLAPLGTEFQINVYTTSQQAYAHASIHPDGSSFAVVWHSSGQDGDDAGIFGAGFDFVTGAPADGEFQVNEATTGIQNGGAVAILPTSGTSGSKSEYPGNPQDPQNPGLAFFPDDNIAAVLESETDSLTDLVLMYLAGAEPGNINLAAGPDRASATSTPPGAQHFVVNTYTSDYQGRGDVCSDSSGNFIVTWTSFGQEADGPGVYGQRFNANGTRNGTEFHVNTYTTGYQLNSEVCCGADGNFVVVWNSTDFSGGGQDGDVGGMFGQRFGNDGLPAGGEFQINTYTTGDQSSGVLACDADGNFVSVWNSVTNPGGIIGRAFSAAAVPIGGEFIVADTGGGANPVSPAVGMSNTGDFVVGWHEYGGDAAHNGVRARSFSVGFSTTTTTTTTLPTGQACGDPIVEGGQVSSGYPGLVTASDALFILQASVGLVPCELCVCDVNNSGANTASDALTVLNRAVGIMVTLDCPACSL